MDKTGLSGNRLSENLGLSGKVLAHPISQGEDNL